MIGGFPSATLDFDIRCGTSLCDHPNLRKTVKKGYGSSPKIDGLTALAKAFDDWPAEIFGSTSTATAIEVLRAEQALHRQKAEEHHQEAEAIEVAIKFLSERPVEETSVKLLIFSLTQ